MQELCSLLFELSNEDRLSILNELKKTPMKLSHLSEKLGFTVPETARNVTRLSEANLVTKELDGNLSLTPLGEEALALLPAFKFLSKNRRYFLSHTMSALPPFFSSGVGTLEDATFSKEIATTIFNAERMGKGAQEFIWVMVDQIVVSYLPIVEEAIGRGVEFRKLMPRSAEENMPDGIHTLANAAVFEKAARAKKLESRYLDRIDLCILMSEEEATIIFPNREGKFDFSSFQTKNKLALNWAQSLFTYYWNKAKR